MIDNIEETVIKEINSIFAEELWKTESIFYIRCEVVSYLYNLISQNIVNQNTVDFYDPLLHKSIKYNSFQTSLVIFNRNVSLDIYNFDFHSKADIKYFLDTYGQEKLDEWINLYKVQKQIEPINASAFTFCSISANKNPRREKISANVDALANHCYGKSDCRPLLRYDLSAVEIGPKVSVYETIKNILYYLSNENLLTIKKKWRNDLCYDMDKLFLSDKKEWFLTTDIYSLLKLLHEYKMSIQNTKTYNCNYIAKQLGEPFITKFDFIKLCDETIFSYEKAFVDICLNDVFGIQENYRMLDFFINGFPDISEFIEY